MVPQILDARADQFVLEFASRELKELELCREFAERGEVGVGVVDVKSLYVETAEEIAERLRAVSDIRSCRKTLREPGLRFFHLPRNVALQKCATWSLAPQSSVGKSAPVDRESQLAVAEERFGMLRQAQ